MRWDVARGQVVVDGEKVFIREREREQPSGARGCDIDHAERLLYVGGHLP